MITVANVLTTTVVVTQTPSAVPPEQVSEADSQTSQITWIVVAMIFLAIAIVSFTSSIILGYMLYRKARSNKATIVADIPSATEITHPEKEGVFNS